MDGVSGASFDLVKAEVSIEFDPATVDADQLVDVAQAAVDEGVEVVEGSKQGFYLPPEDFPAGLDVQWLARDGSSRPLKPAVVEGKITIFDFWASWCGPCRQLDKALIERLQNNDRLAVRKFNVVDWKSDVAREHLRNVTGLPYVEVWRFDPKKGPRRVGAVNGLDIDRLDRLIARAGPP